MPKETKQIIQITKQIMFLLKCKNFTTLIGITGGERITGKEIENEINAYGRTIIIPPDMAYDEIDIIKCVDMNRFSVNMPFWTSEEGRSDLTLQLTIDFSTKKPIIAIDDIHVL